MREIKRNISAQSKRSLMVYFWIALSILLLFMYLPKLTPQRVGDGNEYYALYLAWKETLRPWMNDASYQAFQQLYQSNTISGMMPEDWLRGYSPALRLRDESDFNHFWLYSFLAFAVARFCQIFGLLLGPHTAFLGLHFFLVTGVAFIAYHLYGKRGILVFTLMTLFSPMLWFSDKVHTELFTYCLTLAGVMLVYSRKYTCAALFLALASTQNPSFALIAFIPFAFRFCLEKNKPFSIFEVFMMIGTAFAVLAHPVYYFLRFGVPTPQLLAGGASLGGNLSNFYIWLFDPDLGLIPNWPLGILLILLAVSLVVKNKSFTQSLNTNKYFYLFSSIFLIVSLFANSSTTNLNSGATPGLARYALWYLPLLFPAVLYVINNFPSRKVISYPLALVIAIIGYASIKTNAPSGPEGYDSPSWLSNAIQLKLPWLYTPPAEVFKERFSGLGETSYENIRGVLGPDCHKLLIFPGEHKELVTVPARCLIDSRSLGSLINESPLPLTDTFYNLSDSQYDQLMPKVTPGKYSLATSGNGLFALTSGWWTPENWGVWTVGRTATLTLPCTASQYYADQDKIDMTLSLHGFGRQKVTITQDRKELFDGHIEAQGDLPLRVNIDKCSSSRILIKIAIKDPVAPSDVMQSEDRRKLGIGVYSFTLK
ncbi:hypothetical protein GHO40_10805 [Pseudomonas helleri]|uniref:Glycosyltransferase RgtA/B/C/D-like domain-containing protein n=1 Tax=Pseudomonas helleri TaxID=1608996 RepID=A0A7X1W8L7_9PSED|nr:hypothetical protein [Pseudomonas helleri]MQT47215.1 hypothetical protein [Pseudomonas helleri]